jgi:hypothetical protein
MTVQITQVPDANTSRIELELTIADGHRKYLLRRVSPRDRRVQDIQRRAGPSSAVIGVWVGHGFAVIFTVDDTPHGVLRHVSISHKHRDPNWNEIRSVRSTFFPMTRDVMMMLPKEADYINVHEHCFHLWDTPAEWGIQ